MNRENTNSRTTDVLAEHRHLILKQAVSPPLPVSSGFFPASAGKDPLEQGFLTLSFPRGAHQGGSSGKIKGRWCSECSRHLALCLS